MIDHYTVMSVGITHFHYKYFDGRYFLMENKYF